ncbi:MAG TPA: Calx-beta domain-containing protein [bacterium]|nr:Calx-beta domain-containing protein [bacterium]
MKSPYVLASLILLSRLAFAPSPASASDLLVSSQNTHNVLRYNGTTGAFIGEFVVAGSGGLDGPDGMAFGPDGNLYVLDFEPDKIFRFDGSTGAFIDEFVSSGTSGDDLILGPDQNFYAADFDNAIVRKVTPSGVSSAFATAGENLDFLVFGPDGNLYVSDSAKDSVFRFDGTTGALIDTFVTAGAGGLSAPGGLDFGPDGNLYVDTLENNQVLKFDGNTGAFLSIFVPAGSGGLDGPFDLFFRSDGRLYVVSANTNQILRYDGTTGDFIDAFVTAGSGGLDVPLCMTLLPAGSLEFSTAAVSAGEADGTVTITVNRTGGVNGAVTVGFATSDGTAVAGADYTANSGTLTFAEGETSKTFTVAITEDTDDESDETVNLMLSNPTDDATLGAIATAVLTVTDDDDPAGGGCSLIR